MTLINGKSQTQIDVTDRGLAYGDGVFETIAFVNGALHNWDRHWQRLKIGAERLAIELPEEQQILAQVYTEVGVSLNKADVRPGKTSDWIVKIILTRGKGGRGYQSPVPQQVSSIILKFPWTERSVLDYQQGIHVIVCQTCLANQPALAGIKHLNRLEQILARNEFKDENFQEGIMLSCSDKDARKDSLMVEGISSNLFFVIDGLLCTPLINNSGVRGTIREEIIFFAPKLGIRILQDDYPLRTLEKATEVFFTNSIYGILPVASITHEDSVLWNFKDRTISSQIAAIINKAINRPPI